MEGILGRVAPQIYALIVPGLLFAVHGAQKLLGVLGGQQVPIVSQFGLAGVIELVGGLMIAAVSSPAWRRSLPAARWPSRTFRRTPPKPSGRAERR